LDNNAMTDHERSRLNKTIVLGEEEIERLSARLKRLTAPVTVRDLENVTIHQE
jgi:hypothetical protein